MPLTLAETLAEAKAVARMERIADAIEEIAKHLAVITGLLKEFVGK